MCLIGSHWLNGWMDDGHDPRAVIQMNPPPVAVLHSSCAFYGAKGLTEPHCV